MQVLVDARSGDAETVFKFKQRTVIDAQNMLSVAAEKSSRRCIANFQIERRADVRANIDVNEDLIATPYADQGLFLAVHLAHQADAAAVFNIVDGAEF